MSDFAVCVAPLEREEKMEPNDDGEKVDNVSLSK